MYKATRQAELCPCWAMPTLDSFVTVTVTKECGQNLWILQHLRYKVMERLDIFQSKWKAPIFMTKYSGDIEKISLKINLFTNSPNSQLYVFECLNINKYCWYIKHITVICIFNYNNFDYIQNIVNITVESLPMGLFLPFFLLALQYSLHWEFKIWNWWYSVFKWTVRLLTLMLYMYIYIYIYTMSVDSDIRDFLSFL